ncbi:hypothetical protein ACFOY8_11925 [Thalassospira xianhensis]|uniref:Uncharacterized protein n=1 Tax=Thalassospira xianhensis MCCC 1A02616 TaxID=1177929 RepID=A0A367U800_9PROT|nr:hypothetical protein [Thalassospira xianhensis]RCK04141.1 hypothetical protein TH5_21410 [Thalassospira xianhensis MCCC 1A02616]
MPIDHDFLAVIDALGPDAQNGHDEIERIRDAYFQLEKQNAELAIPAGKWSSLVRDVAFMSGQQSVPANADGKPAVLTVFETAGLNLADGVKVWAGLGQGEELFAEGPAQLHHVGGQYILSVNTEGKLLVIDATLIGAIEPQ